MSLTIKLLVAAFVVAAFWFWTRWKSREAFEKFQQEEREAEEMRKRRQKEIQRRLVEQEAARDALAQKQAQNSPEREDFAFSCLALLADPRTFYPSLGNVEPPPLDAPGRRGVEAKILKHITDARQGNLGMLADWRWVRKQFDEWNGIRSQIGRFYLNPSISAAELDAEVRRYEERRRQGE